MKTFKDEQIVIKDKSSSYSELLLACVNNTPKEGFTVEEMRARSRIIDAVEQNTDGKIKLEDADYQKALNCVNTMRWAVLDKQIVKFNEAFAGIK